MAHFFVALLLVFARQVSSFPGQSFSAEDYLEQNNEHTLNKKLKHFSANSRKNEMQHFSESLVEAIFTPKQEDTKVSIAEIEFNRALIDAFVNKTIATGITASKDNNKDDGEKDKSGDVVEDQTINTNSDTNLVNIDMEEGSNDSHKEGDEDTEGVEELPGDIIDEKEDDDESPVDVDEDSIDENEVDDFAPEKKNDEVDCGTDLSPLRNGLGAGNFLWPQGNIPYVIGENFNQTFRQNIKEAVQYYNSVLQGCINWKERTNEQNYVIFKFEQSCSSKIGRAFWPVPLSQPIFLGRCAHSLGHIKHEMMNTVGFYHEHSRSDRDMYIQILWNNIPVAYQSQFSTHRWTTAYGEKYDYKSIMHYSSRAFVKDRSDPDMRTILPLDDTVNSDDLGWKKDLSKIDIAKIKKMYKCPPYDTWKSSCSSEGDCGVNEYCSSYVSGECRTQLPNGSLCVSDAECVHYCGQGVCSSCSSSSQCPSSQYCSYTYLPMVENQCQDYCSAFCFYGGQCGGDCGRCSWSFTCQK